MSTRMTKSTLTALERTDFVVASIRIQKPTITDELTRNFIASMPEGTPMPDWDGLQEAHALRLEFSGEEIRRAEKDYRQQLDQMRGYRKQRQAIVKSLLAGYRSLRNSVTGNYPEGGLTVLGIEEQPVVRFAAVREQMPETLGRLRDPELPARMSEPLPGHQPLDFEHFAAPMEAGIQALEDSMKSIQQMRKILDESLLAKRETLKNNRRTYLNLARIQEGYYRLAGLDELADRIRTEVYLLTPRRKDSAEPVAGTPAEETSPEAQGTPAVVAPATIPEATASEATVSEALPPATDAESAA